MPRGSTKVQGQVGMDEEVLDLPEVEKALEDRQEWKERAAEVGKSLRTAHEKATGLLQEHIPQEVGVYRVGRFRLERKEVPERHVEFDTQPKVRVSIQADEA